MASTWARTVPSPIYKPSQSWVPWAHLSKWGQAEFHWNTCIHLIWCHVWIASTPCDVWLWAHKPPPPRILLITFPFYEKKPITKSERWNVISSDCSNDFMLPSPPNPPPTTREVIDCNTKGIVFVSTHYSWELTNIDSRNVILSKCCV